MQWQSLFSMAITLFLLMDAIGNVPIFVSVLKDIQPKHHRHIIFRELFIALLIILLFYFVGNSLLNFLKVSIPTILIAGGVILFLIALRMIFPTEHKSKSTKLSNKDPLIVPLAVPLIAGPAVLAAVMLYAGQTHIHPLTCVGAIVLAWIASTLILVGSSLCQKILGERGLIALERLMGLILTLLAIEMFLEGVSTFLKMNS